MASRSARETSAATPKSAAPEVEFFRLPEWNDLTNEQRIAICDEAELWSFDQCLERDAASALYDLIRKLVRVEPPPLMLAFAALGPQVSQPIREET